MAYFRFLLFLKLLVVVEVGKNNFKFHVGYEEFYPATENTFHSFKPGCHIFDLIARIVLDHDRSQLSAA